MAQIERGTNKHTYSCKKVFWDAVETLIQWNHTAETAMDQIQKAYEHNEMRQDKKRGILRFKFH